MIRKRPSGNWTVYKWNKATGKAESHGTYPTWAEARKVDHLPDPRPNRRILCEHFAQSWLKRIEQTRAPSTHAGYSQALKVFMAEFAGIHLDEFEDEMRTPLRTWAQDQPEYVYRTVRRLLNYAIGERHLKLDPLDRLQRNDTPPPEIVVITEEQLERLSTSCDVLRDFGPQMRSMVMFAAWVGLRPGELFALAPGDVDLESNRVHIRQSTRADGSLGPTKNKKERVVALPAPAREHLIPRLGPILFPTSTGRRFTKANFGDNYWHPVREEAGLPKMRFYDLRHFCATQIHERSGLLTDISFQLGHSDNGITALRNYVHPSRDDALERVEELLRPEPQTDVTVSKLGP